jgi:hypothetical protein
VPSMPGMGPVAGPNAAAESLYYGGLLVVAAALCLVVWLERRRLGPWMGVATGPPAGGAAAARNLLAYLIGGLWLLDAFLQAQPAMVTHFVGGLLAPLTAGQPAPVAALLRLGVEAWRLSPVGSNLLATVVQFLIGAALLFSQDGAPIRRPAVWASLAWALWVWGFGEGFGGVLAGGGALTGAPGSAVLYAAAAALLLAPASVWESGRVWRWASRGVAGLFALSALLQAWPAAGWWGASTFGGYVRAMAAMPQPSWLAAPLAAFGRAVASDPVPWNAALVVSSALLAAAWLVAPASRLTLWASILWTVAVWYLGQDFGVMGGMGTDPNTGAVMLAFWIVWGTRRGRQAEGGAGRRPLDAVGSAP